MALNTIPELLATVERLPAGDRPHARARVAAAVELPAPAARAALGLLALDLAPLATERPAARAGELEVLIDLGESGTPHAGIRAAAAAPVRT